MDRVQEDMQLLGPFGIYKESYKIITSWKKIFSQITLTLILPLSFIYLIHMEVSNRIFWRIRYTEFELHRIIDGYPSYNRRYLSSEWTVYILFKAAYLTFLLIFSLLSTSAVVYTIASIYTNRDVTFKKVMKVVPRVWKRLMITFVVIFLAMFVYNIVAFFTLMLCFIIGSNFAVVLFFIILIIYALGFVYMTIVWQLASVVTVLEDSYGVKAMKKSKDLIKGKRWVASFIFFKLNVTLVAIQVLFQIFVADEYDFGLGRKIGFGILCLVLLVLLILFGLVIQTIIYFVCKSYHHESIDKSALSEHLEGYMGEYERLNKPKDVQLEQQYHDQV